MKKSFAVFTMSLAFGLCAHAQNHWDVFGEYSYLQFNPSLTGLQSRAFNGGGGGVTWYPGGKAFGIRAEFDGYGSTTWTVDYTTPVVVTPHGVGVIPTGHYSSQGDMFTYLFGPVVRAHKWHGFSPYGQVLFGGASTDGYANLTRAFVNGGASISVASSQHPFAMVVGGGLDYDFTKSFAIRFGEVDYMLTRFTNPVGGTGNQNSFRYVGGVVFRFGGQ